MAEKATYTHGHHASVLSTHSRRTIHDSARFLIPHVKPTDRILDLGCGPGSITIGLATLVPQGSVIGGDVVEDVLDQARNLASSNNVTNITFQQVDGNALPFKDGEFDICYAHQTLQHVADPVAILKEMKRVVKKGGFVAARDADYLTFTWNPGNPGLEMWNRMYRDAAKSNGAEPDAGRHMLQWAREAGFAAEDVTFTWDCWNYQGEGAKAFGQSWKDRALYSAFAKTALQKGLATQEDLNAISKAWDEFSGKENAFLIVPNGEILCRVS